MGLLGLFALCIVALVFLLPHAGPSTSLKKQGGGANPNVTPVNIPNPLTTIGPSTTINSSVTTTVTTGPGGNQSQSSPTTSTLNFSDYAQSLVTPTNSTTTTILYAYCVGSPTPSFNQSYYSQLDMNGAESWKATTNYPIPFLNGACASNGAKVYCIGDDSLFFKGMPKRPTTPASRPRA